MRKKRCVWDAVKGTVELVEDQHNEIMGFPQEHREELLLVCSPSGRVVYLSGPLKLMLDEDLTGRNLNDFVEDKVAAQVVGQVQQGKSVPFECVISGQRFDCRAELDDGEIYVQLTPLNQRGGSFITMNAARFVSREVKTELSILLPAMKHMEALVKTEKQQKEMAIMRRSFYRILRTMRNLEDCAAAENGVLEMHFQEEDLTALFRRMKDHLTELCAQNDFTLLWNLPDKPLLRYVDGEKIQRIVLHLVANAMGAQSNGTIVISLRERDSDVCISVVDNGPGIDNRIMGDVFRKYCAMDPMKGAGAGAGFGLALVRAFTERHGGRMLLMSNEGQGASVQLLLPETHSPEPLQLRTHVLPYGTGLDPMLVELSTVLPPDVYLSQPQN